MAQEAERLGYDSAWAAEAWGTDCVTVLSWLGATTERIKLGSAIMQIPGRTPANTAMTAATLDLLSGGRLLLGLGTSGPQVVEGWHGEPWGKPLGKTREYVEIVRTALRRELVEHHGEHYDIPYGNGTGLGKPLKLMARPLRADIPIYLAVMGPKAVAQAFEIADGWLPIFWSPEKARDAFGSAVAKARPEFDIAATAPVILIDDVEAGREFLAVLRALHRGNGRARQELLQRARDALRLRGRGTRSRTSTSRGASAMQPLRYPTHSSTTSPSSGRRNGSRSGSTSGGSPVRRRSSSRRSSRRRCARSPRSSSEIAGRSGPRDRRCGRLGEVGHTLFEARRALVLGAELAPHEAAVDRLAEDGSLPEGEPFEPVKVLDAATAARDVAFDELLGRKPGWAVTGDVPSGFGVPPGSLYVASR